MPQLRTRVGLGAVAALIVTPPVLVLSYLAATLLGLGYLPFRLFEGLAGALDGALLTRAIEALVRTLTAFNLPLSAAGKLAEQGLAVLLCILLALGVSALWFCWPCKRPIFAGAALGTVLGVLSFILTSRLPATLAADLLFFSLTTAFWGALLGWLRKRLFFEPLGEASGEPLRGASHESPGGLQATDAALQTAEGAAAETLPGVTPLSRRAFLLRSGGAAAIISVAGAAVAPRLFRAAAEVAPLPKKPSGPATQADALAEGAPWSASHALPNQQDPVQPVPGTRAELTPLAQFYRIDINLTPPRILEADWGLEVTGLVGQPQTYTLADLKSYAPEHQFITMLCISNPVAGDLTSTTRWTGVPLQDLLPAWALDEGATHLRISSQDGFFEYVSLAEIRADRRIMLAYLWDGLPLPEAHGYPLRLYLPNRYGMKQPKWITTIEAVAEWQPGYWVARTWDKDAFIKATSVIDTVVLPAGGVGDVLVGGIAFAGDRGVSKVEVQVDNGLWQEAELRAPLSALTWVVWRYAWPFAAGRHTFRVRCTERGGERQIADSSRSYPSGATGLHQLVKGFPASSDV